MMPMESRSATGQTLLCLRTACYCLLAATMSGCVSDVSGNLQQLARGSELVSMLGVHQPSACSKNAFSMLRRQHSQNDEQVRQL